MSTRVAEMGDRILLRLTGPALKFLHDVCSQEVAGLAPGSGAPATFLDDKGRVLADGLILATESGAIVIAEEAAAAGLERAVERVAPLAGVEVARERVHALRVSGASEPLQAAGFLVLPDREHGFVEEGGAVCVRVLWGADGFDVHAPHAAGLLDLLAGAGAVMASKSEAEDARIAAGRPLYGADITEATHVNETPLLERSVSFEKGCYPGQESVARIRNLGRVRKRLRVLRIDGPVDGGVEVTRDGVVVGAVTSAGERFAMAMLDAGVEPGAAIRAGDVGGRVVEPL